MVKKLFKHEFKTMLRYMIPIESIVLALFVFARIIFLFESDNFVYGITVFSVIMMLIAATFAGNIAILILAIIRYYKNLFTLQGYLSFTLPVTPAQHIMVKVVTAVVFDITAAITALLGICIAISGNIFTEVADVIGYALKYLTEEFGTLHIILYAIEIVIVLILSSFSKFLLYYGFITIGQMANRKKLLLAFGAYGAYTFISGVFSTIINIIYNFFAFSNIDFIVRIYEFFENHQVFSLHISFTFSIVASLVSCIIWFGVSNLIIHKKLNLE